SIYGKSNGGGNRDRINSINNSTTATATAINSVGSDMALMLSIRPAYAGMGGGVGAGGDAAGFSFRSSCQREGAGGRPWAKPYAPWMARSSLHGWIHGVFRPRLATRALSHASAVASAGAIRALSPASAVAVALHHARAVAVALAAGVFAFASVAPAGASNSTRVLDDFEDASAWRVVASDQVSGSIRRVEGAQGGALCLDYDFNGVSGYAGIQRDLELDYPGNYRFGFRLRAESPA